MPNWTASPIVGRFDLVDIENAHIVITADFVTTDEGTGLVHLAPAFGADDLEACRRRGLPVVNPVGRDGRFEPDLALVGGALFTDADPVLVADLRPASRAERIDLHLAEQMILARKVVELGRTTRTEAALKTRQPLTRGLVAAAGWQDVPDQLRTEIAAELNVGTLDATSGAGEVVDHAVRPRFRVLGRRFGSRTQQVCERGPRRRTGIDGRGAVCEGDRRARDRR